MLVGREYMNKKLIASLLTLGLVLSPVSGAVSESYATEVSSEERERELALEKIGIIKNYLNYYQSYKDSNDYRLADDASRAKLDKAAIDAEEYSKKNEVSLAELDKHISNIENAIAELASNASNNQKSLKIIIINSNKLLANNDSKKETDEYKLVAEKIANAMGVLKKDNIANSDYDKLIKANNELAQSFIDAKEKFEDKSIYQNPTDEELSKLDEELNKDGKITISFDKLLEDRQALIDKNESFKNTEAYVNASPEKKEAYEKAFEELDSITDQSESLENYNNISEKLRKLAQARYDIEGEDLGLNTIKVAPSVDDKAKEIENEIRILKSYINDKGNINKIFSKPGFKDDALKKSYNEAFTKALNVVLGKEKLKDLKEYQDLSAQLKKLTEEIKSKKISEEKPTDTTKIDKLKAVIEKANKFLFTDDFASASPDQRKKLKDALIDAEFLNKKHDEDPSSVKDEAIDKAIKALEAALDDFYGFNNKDAARKALEALLAKTAGIKIDQIYDTSDQKDAKDAYTKARENAAKLVKNKDASVEDLAKAYKDLDDVLNKLAEFLNKRLKDLVDDHPKFSESDKYKKVDANLTKDDVILNYLTVLADAKKELDKAAPDANALNNLYKKLKNARAEINGDMSSQARKLADAIIDGRALMETEEYKKLKAGLTGERKKAAELYSRYLAVAEELQKAGKLDSQDAKDILDLIDHARDFIEGKITEEKYLGNYYYHTLKALKTYKNGEEYKNLPQALRDKLDKALELYEKSSDEKAVFSALDAVWREDAIQAIIKKMELERNPNVTRDKLLEDLNNLIAEDKKLKEGGFKYQKAQKVLRDAYDQALQEAKDFIAKNDKPTEEQVRAVYKKLLNAKNALDGDKFDKLIHDLAARFKKEQMKIANPADRQAIADKINSLAGENMTMDDALRVEKELNDLINPKFAATQTLVPQGGVPTTTRPVSTVTNPGSIVKTGINGIAKVAVVLVAALGIFKLTSNKGDKK